VAEPSRVRQRSPAVSSFTVKVALCTTVSSGLMVEARVQVPVPTMVRVVPLTVRSPSRDHETALPLTVMFRLTAEMCTVPAALPALKVTSMSPDQCTRPKGPVHSFKWTWTMPGVASSERVAQPAGHHSDAEATLLAAAEGSLEATGEKII